ncbi:rhomboid family intramembrane serine protease [Paenibacillus spiritus]|uniref:Rhomboid family intramembrane serine protease n=1 Tax=Paenibacillus spiritus TaxID=2496557 RepID=A0A5J5G005_9BACL|nr:rhomboid family intramembrane serine protease [Paenibacillus spiritus]KAA8999829.1 rhomboid family intramembrane serine protease [Paenibacillus spiritus]
MLFIRYENWKSYLRYYPVTTLIVAANLVMFIILSLNGGSTDPYTLLHYGAMVDIGPERTEWWRLVTSIFLHNGISHLLFNCFAILVFAPPLERLMGWARYAVLYILGGVVGNLVSMGVSGEAVYAGTVSVGASGAIYAVYGAFLYIALLQRFKLDEGSRKTLYSLLLLGVITTFAMPNINWAAHLGGLIGGFFLYGLIVRIAPSRTMR